MTRLTHDPGNPADLELSSRLVTERLALALQASLLVRAGNHPVADVFCATRIERVHGLAFGTLPAHTAMDALITHAFP